MRGIRFSVITNFRLVFSFTKNTPFWGCLGGRRLNLKRAATSSAAGTTNHRLILRIGDGLAFLPNMLYATPLESIEFSQEKAQTAPK